jgi:hypothetical protein
MDINQDMNPMPVARAVRREPDPLIVAAQDNPRNVGVVKREMLAYATLDEETAAACFYSLPRGGKTIQGPSVRLAEIALSCYGNAAVRTRIIAMEIDSDQPHVVVCSEARDLEKNVSVSIEKRRRIIGKKDYKTGDRKTPDEDDINLAVNACSAIAYRDAVFKVIPGALVKPVYEKAREVAVGKATSFNAKRDAVIARLNQMGVHTPRILAVMEVKSADEIAGDKLADLIGLGTAIKEGTITIEEAFPPVPPTIAKPVFDQPTKAANGFSEAAVKPTEAHGEAPPIAKKPQPAEPHTTQAENTPAENGGATPTPTVSPAIKGIEKACREAQVTFDDLRQWVIGSQMDGSKNADSWASWLDIPEAVAGKLFRGIRRVIADIQKPEELL